MFSERSFFAMCALMRDEVDLGYYRSISETGRPRVRRVFADINYLNNHHLVGSE